MTRKQTLELLHSKMKNQNLRRHSYAVEAGMRALAKHFGKDEEKWGIAGLIHDADYEMTKDKPDEHTKHTVEWLRAHDFDVKIEKTVLAHGWGFVPGNPEPKSKMEWALYCVDELTGFIVAVALVKPDRKLASVSLDSIKKKWGQKSFAAGVHREQIELCGEKLGTGLDEFITITLEAMQKISNDLGL